MALFLQAVYSESLFLLLALAAFLLAERRRFLGAGASPGWRCSRARPGSRCCRRSCCSPGGRRDRRARSRRCSSRPRSSPSTRSCSGSRPASLGASLRSQELWHRHLSPAGPLGGIWDGLRAGWAGVQQLVGGLGRPRLLDRRLAGALRPGPDGGDQPRVPGVPRALRRAHRGRVAALRRAVRALRGVQPRDPALRAGERLAAALAAALRRRDLPALPRARRPRQPPAAHTAIVGASACLLGLAVVQWTLWQWVA